MPRDRIDWPARRREAPWRRPRRPRRKKVDRKAQRQATAELQAGLKGLQAAWQEHWSPPQKYKSKAHERWCRAWFVRYQQACGRWEYAAKGLVDRACLMQPQTLRKVLSVADLQMLSPELYFPIDLSSAQELDWDKVVPVPKPPFSKFAPGFARLLQVQKTALLEAGYVPPEAAKQGSAKSANSL